MKRVSNFKQFLKYHLTESSEYNYDDIIKDYLYPINDEGWEVKSIRYGSVLSIDEYKLFIEKDPVDGIDLDPIQWGIYYPNEKYEKTITVHLKNESKHKENIKLYLKQILGALKGELNITNILLKTDYYDKPESIDNIDFKNINNFYLFIFLNKTEIFTDKEILDMYHIEYDGYDNENSVYFTIEYIDLLGWIRNNICTDINQDEEEVEDYLEKMKINFEIIDYDDYIYKIYFSSKPFNNWLKIILHDYDNDYLDPQSYIWGKNLAWLLEKYFEKNILNL